MRKNRVLTQISKIDSEGHKGWLQTQSTLTMYFRYKDVSKTKLTKHNSIELIVPPIGEEKQGLAPKSPKETMKAKLRPNQINKWHKSVNIMYISTHTKLKHAFMCKVRSLLLQLLLLGCFGHKGWLKTLSTLTMYLMYNDVNKTKLTKHNSIELIIPPISEEKQGFTPKSPKETVKAKLRPNQINKWHKSVNIKYISTHTKLKHAYMCKLSSLLLLLSCSAALQNHNFSCQIVGVRSGKQTQADVIFFTSF